MIQLSFFPVSANEFESVIVVKFAMGFGDGK